MIGRIENYFRKTRRKISRSEWAIKLLRLQRHKSAPTAPGLVLMQIDGLSLSHFEKALEEGRLPFASRLMRKEQYAVRSLFSGVPSSMSAVQSEFLYGLRHAVPGFSFYDREHHRRVDLMDPETVCQIEEELKAKGDPLLKDGSAYAGIFSGGAKDVRFSMSDQGLRAFPGKPSPRTVLFLLMSNLYSLARMLGLGSAEVLLALKDFVRGLAKNKEFRREIRSIPTRVAVCILLRELSVIGAKVDIARGLPVIHINFLGYDEQAHRRGPSSPLASWALKGIDDAIARVWRAAHRAGARDYQVWVYSAHGQEDVDSYMRKRKRTVHAAVAEALGMDAELRDFSPIEKTGIVHLRTNWLGKRFRRHSTGTPSKEKLAITAMGTLGHVYLAEPRSIDERKEMACKVAVDASVPMVATAGEDGSAYCYVGKKAFLLPRDGNDLFGPHHPFPMEAAKDLTALCHHPRAGDLILCGWGPGASPVSFPSEAGGHGGPGAEETSGFLLVPEDAPLDWRANVAIRPSDLHRVARNFLHPDEKQRAARLVCRINPSKNVFRVMTYNIHSCVGMDGKVHPERVARVIAQYEPDVVALQEVDVEMMRTGQMDQAAVIAQMLQMEYHFHPSLKWEREKYGDLLLSIHPMRLIRAGELPRIDEPWLEPRGAIMAEIEAFGAKFRVINTHLSLSRRERVMQTESLLGGDWITSNGSDAPVILCGDFNAMPSSPVCRMLCEHLKDAQQCLDDHTPRNTWFGRLPLSRIDHIFVDQRLQVKRVLVPSTHLTRETSDHLPLIVDVKIP